MTWLTSALDRGDLRRRIPSAFGFCNRTLWLLLAALALLAGVAFNWRWLVASGVLSFLLPALPCLAMCGLHLCSHGNDASGCGEQSVAACPKPHRSTH